MQTLRDLAPTSPLLHPEDQTATLDALAAGLAADDPTAAKVVAETARYLGVAVADLVNLAQPGGRGAQQLGRRPTRRPAAGRVRTGSPSTRCAARSPPPRSSLSLPGNPVSLGAATLALEGFLSAIGTGPRELHTPVR